MPLKFSVPCFVVKKQKAKFSELKLLLVFLDDKQKKIVINVIKGFSNFYSSLTLLSEIRQEPKQ